MPQQSHATAVAPEFSQAGFWAVPDSPRLVANFNLGWRFARGAHPGAELVDFDDSGAELVNLPHGVDGVLGDMASGGANYQGPAVYRKVFTPGSELSGRRVVLHFDGVLGASKYWFNGVLLKEHVSSFLPAIVDVTEHLRVGEPNVVTVLADNSDDPSYPPGKPQAQLDFSYFGGIYRNAYLVATAPVHVSNPNEAGVEAGGGVFAVTEKIDDTGARLSVAVHLSNSSAFGCAAPYTVALTLLDSEGLCVARSEAAVGLGVGADAAVRQELLVADPQCWSPETPVLHRLEVRVLDAAGAVIDAVAQKLGIRTLELNITDGVVLNGRVYGHKLIGANRHQDFAQLGFALPDALHWRDAAKLRNAGLRVIRNAHYPQSPAFMDACDALGLFVIVNTPGWQFWNEAPVFGERVFSDIRNMVRRDRNRPSVLLWEPILNETRYPEDFAGKAHAITHDEYPHPGCYTGADSMAQGSSHFDVLFGHPAETGMASEETDSWADREASGKVWFTREWGDNVDDWAAQNSPSRVSRSWGEVPQLVQALHYGKPDYPFTCLDVLHRAPSYHIGGSLWHSFDHQRGYHPDPFYGGIMDHWRRPKLSHELFTSQRPEPSVHIAHLMTPFSPADVTVFAQADSVRLYLNDELVGEQQAGSAASEGGMPAPILTFKDAYRYMDVKAHINYNRNQRSVLRAEAIVDGEVAAVHTVNRARRAVTLKLELDTEGVDLVADGSAAVVALASLCDEDGTVRRLNNGAVEFEISGAATLVAAGGENALRSQISWGEAPALIRLRHGAGSVRIIARYAPAGTHMPAAAVLDFTTTPAAGEFIVGEGGACAAAAADQQHAAAAGGGEIELLRLELERVRKENARLRNFEVEMQQLEFGAP